MAGNLGKYSPATIQHGLESVCGDRQVLVDPDLLLRNTTAHRQEIHSMPVHAVSHVLRCSANTVFSPSSPGILKRMFR